MDVTFSRIFLTGVHQFHIKSVLLLIKRCSQLCNFLTVKLLWRDFCSRNSSSGSSYEDGAFFPPFSPLSPLIKLWTCSSFRSPTTSYHLVVVSLSLPKDCHEAIGTDSPFGGPFIWVKKSTKIKAEK